MTETAFGHYEDPPEQGEVDFVLHNLEGYPEAETESRTIKFIGYEVVEPDYNALIRAARTSDNGATLLVEVLSQIDYIEPTSKIAEYKSTLAKTKDIGVLKRIRVWETVEGEIKEAQTFYNFWYSPEDKKKVQQLLDDTLPFEDTTLLNTINTLLKKLRTEAKMTKRPIPDSVHQTTNEASHLARLLILHEDGKQSF